MIICVWLRAKPIPYYCAEKGLHVTTGVKSILNAPPEGRSALANRSISARNLLDEDPRVMRLVFVIRNVRCDWIEPTGIYGRCNRACKSERNRFARLVWTMRC